jgi:hypothetical protein
VINRPCTSFNGHHWRVQDVKYNFSLSCLSKTIVSHAGVLASIIESYTVDCVGKSGGNESAITHPPHLVHFRFGIHRALQVGGSVTFHTQRVFWPHFHTWEIVDAERNPGIQFASLGHGPVPHDAAVRGLVVTAGWRQRQDRRGDGVSRIARPRLCLQRVGIALLVPLDNRNWTAAGARTRKFRRLPFGGHGIGPLQNLRWTWRCEHCKGEGLVMNNAPASRLFDTALELAVVSVVTRVRDPEIVTALIRLEVDSVVGVQ